MQQVSGFGIDLGGFERDSTIECDGERIWGINFEAKVIKNTKWMKTIELRGLGGNKIFSVGAEGWNLSDNTFVC
jgi:hypothetical protein